MLQRELATERRTFSDSDMSAATRYLIVLFLVWFTGGSCWKQLPKIPAGRRTEYHLQQADGAYKYGYDTGDDSSSVVDADASNNVRGRFQYVDGATGRKIALAYTAGSQGFVPEEVVDSADGSGQMVTGRESETSPQDADYDANGDASYNFNIDTDSYKRTESADARGNVRGKYSYSSREGGSHGVTYIAGENTGFVITSSDSSEIAGVPVNSDGSYSFGYNTADQSRGDLTDAKSNVRGSYTFRSKDDDKTRRVDYVAGTGTGFVAKGDNLPVAALTPVYSAPVLAAPAGAIIQPDGSYSFSFGGGDHSREEKADSKNNVRGSFTFQDGGITRRVNYKAGADTGFVATGDHLPLVPEQPDITVTANTYSSPHDGENSPGDASYSFSYNAKDHTRQESSDAGGNVKGTFSFISTDGVSRQVDYEAGAGKGFLAKGSHLPVAPELEVVSAGVPYRETGTPIYSGGFGTTSVQPDGSYSFAYSKADQSREESADAHNNVRGSYSFRAQDDGKVRRVNYKAGAKTGFVAFGDDVPVAPDTAVALGLPSVAGAKANVRSGGEGSYSFGYSTADHSREETADQNNNVKGSFSFVAKDDDKSRKVDYEAGAATGFLARGSHLPVVPALDSVSNPHLVVLTDVKNGGSGNSADGSYSFSFNTPDQSRQESGDSAGNVKGIFSFVAMDDGQSRRVEYEAGANTGFIAKGAHIPSVPSNSGSSYASSSGADQDSGGDASYSYNYETDSSSKSESSDSMGNVKGVYSYRSGDGITRTLKYTSRENEGFVVQEDVAAPTFGQAPLVSTASSRTAGGRNYVLHKYLPPENKHKFGYILDTTA